MARSKIFKTEKVKLSKLKEADYNPRLISEDALDGLKKSMNEFGYVEPIVWNKKTGNVVGGHQRLKVLKDSKISEIEVVVVNLSKEKEKLLNLSLNNPHIQGVFDSAQLSEIFDEISKTFDNDFMKSLKLDLLNDVDIKIPEYKDDEDENVSDIGKNEYVIEIKCEDEFQQQELLKKFKKQNLECRARIL